MPLLRTPEGKVVLYGVSTGERFIRWPIDAREMLASGEYTGVPPNTHDADPSPSYAPTVTPAQEQVASRVGAAMSASQFYAEQRAADVRDPMPHVAAALAQTTAQSPTGAPLVVAPSDSPKPVAAPVQLPPASGSAGRRKR